MLALEIPSATWCPGTSLAALTLWSPVWVWLSPRSWSPVLFCDYCSSFALPLLSSRLEFSSQQVQPPMSPRTAKCSQFSTVLRRTTHSFHHQDSPLLGAHSSWFGSCPSFKLEPCLSAQFGAGFANTRKWSLIPLHGHYLFAMLNSNVPILKAT